MTQTAHSYHSHPDTSSLIKVMRTLINEYEETRVLIGDQIQALVKHDLDRMNTITMDQVEKYEVLKKLEYAFKDEMNRLCDQCTSKEEERTLTTLLRNLKEPQLELNGLRDTLREQVSITEKFKKQLTELLEFAKDHNAETLKSIYEAGSDASMHYSEEGKRTTALKSVAINRKV